MTTGPTDAGSVCVRSLPIMATGEPADFEAVYTADAQNRESKDEPPASRGTGPTAMYATALWLRTAFSELAWEVHDVFPPRGRRFAVTQTHWFRVSDGRVAEHWANRDDLAMGEQLGWTPPTPVYLARMLRARRAGPPRRDRVGARRPMVVASEIGA